MLTDTRRDHSAGTNIWRTLDELRWAILESPADNTLRLIYADAAESTGKPWQVAHAELIRLQVQRAIDGQTHANARETSILRMWGAKWLPVRGRLDFSNNGSGLAGFVVDGAKV